MSDPTIHVSAKTYAIGFFLSLLLTLSAYLFVQTAHFPRSILFAVILACGTLQALVQLVCFLHLGKESKPRWNLAVFLFMALIAATVVAGSLLIMKSLNYRMME